jgi:adenosine deaminase
MLQPDLISPDLPLIDLHRHLEGSVRPATVLELGLRHGIPLPATNLPDLLPHIQVSEPQPDLFAFFARFELVTSVLVDYDACRRIAAENVENAQAEGIDYLELRFSPWFMAQVHGLDPAGVTAAVVEGAAEGSRATGVLVNLIGIISRTYGPEVGQHELDALLTQRDHIAALDLAGDEPHYPAALFEPHFRRARAAGWHITVHAGEAAGPESIWQAIRLLGAERIGHGLSAVKDERLLDYLAANRIGIEMSLTSNVQTSSVAGYDSHPVKRLLAAGLAVTINSDDPAISGIDLRHEYNVAAPRAGLSREQIRTLQRNALDIAFLPDEDKARLRAAKLRSQPGV